jgi:ABC-type polysaccharide/polyol phosphate export permease
MDKDNSNTAAFPYIDITPDGLKRVGRSPFEELRKLKTYLLQAAHLTRWSLSERTFGRVLGAVWIVLDPILQAFVLFMILSVVFNIRGSDVSFLAIFMTVTLWRPTLNLISIGPALLVGRAALLQQTNFPIILILFETLGVELAILGLNVGIVGFLLVMAGKTPTLLWLLFPFVFIVQLLFTVALMMALMGIGTFVRDTAAIVAVFMNIVFYASPIVYGMERIAEPWRSILYVINPLTHIFPAYRAIFIDFTMPHLLPLVLIGVLSVIAILLQLRVLETLRHRFYQYL